MHIFHIGRLEAEEIHPKYNQIGIDANKTALISITEDNGYVKLKDGWKEVLRLHFYDLGDDLFHDESAYIKRGMSFFGENHAKEILYFVRNLPKEIDTIYIHCEAGVSRSAAVRKFLCDYYDQYCDWLPTKKIPYHDDNVSYEDTYNRRVYRILHEEWEKEKKEYEEMIKKTQEQLGATCNDPNLTLNTIHSFKFENKNNEE